MASPIIFRRIQREDLPGSDDSMFRLLNILNPLLESVASALNGQLTLKENNFAESRTVLLEHGVETTIGLQKITKPKFVFHGYAAGFEVDTLNILNYVSDSEIEIKAYFKTDPGTPVEVELMFLNE